MGLLQNFNKQKVQIPAHDPTFTIRGCRPAYPKQQSGVCLIVGTHPDWARDVDEAFAHYPTAHTCAVNEATTLIPTDHIATCHGDKLPLFLSLHDKAWDDRYPMPDAHIQLNRDSDKMPLPCHRWDFNFGGGSAIFAAVAMISLGYELVIMCGCPMVGGDGYALADTHESTQYDPRLGYLPANHSMITSWHQSMHAMIEKAPDIAGKIRSMSGKTKDIFGGIE